MMNRGSTQTLWNQSNECMILFPQQMVILEKIHNSKKNSALYISPIFDIKKSSKTIRILDSVGKAQRRLLSSSEIIGSNRLNNSSSGEGFEEVKSNLKLVIKQSPIAERSKSQPPRGDRKRLIEFRLRRIKVLV